MKRCNRCGDTKSLSEFYIRRASKDGYAHRCKPCDREVVKKWNEEHPRAQWSTNLKRYGLTPEEYEAILEKQGGVCAICHQPPKSMRLHVDHNHETGQVRGLLCHGCNTSLGHLRENRNIIHALLGYLDKAQSTTLPLVGKDGC